MSFWADKLNQGGAAQPAVPPPVPASPSGAWWAPQSQVQSPAGQQAPLLPAVYVPVKPPPHLRASGFCPECGSDSYFEVDPKQGPRCYACGATSGNRTRNSTQGTAVVSQRSGPTKAARQVTGPGYRPDIIVGSI